MASTKEKAVKATSGSAKSGGSGKSGSKSPRSLVPPELFQVGSYKRNQGRTVRLVTAVTFGVIIALSAWRLYDTMATWTVAENWTDWKDRLTWIVPGLMLFGGWWLCYRVINLPRFADFLIAVEAEMTKVSWPTQTELYRSSLVVIFFIVALAGVLFLFDLFWQMVFRNLGILGLIWF